MNEEMHVPLMQKKKKEKKEKITAKCAHELKLGAAE